MKNIKLTLIIITAFSSLVFPQSKISSSFVQLKSGEKIVGELQIVKKILDIDYILVNDTLAIASEKIEYYRTEEGYFAIVNGKAAKRVFKGKLDLYYESNIKFIGENFNTAQKENNNLILDIKGRIVDNSQLYYSKNGSLIKEVNYSNLVNDLNDNAESMKLLKEYNGLTYLKYGFGVIGAGILVYWLTNFDSNSIDNIKKPNWGFFIAGGFAIGFSFLIDHYQEPYLKKAVDNYIGLR